jgi:galactoside O-acetyltransferase
VNLISFPIFLLKRIKATFVQCYSDYRFFLKFGYAPPPGVFVNQISEIRVGKRVSVSPGCSLYCQDPENGSELEIGDGVRLNHNVMINADRGGKIRIGNDVLIGPNVVIRGANHRFLDLSKKVIDQGHEPGTIVIGDNVWISANAVILPGVTLGNGSIVAAGAVVRENVLPYTVVGGVPAKEIKKLK